MINQIWPYTVVNAEIYNKRTDWPKISIVTPSFNQGQFIEETILSILNQNYPNLEYIIIDGGSTDNTVEVIKKYEDRITYWVSKPDKGQADAINQGLEKCTGEIFNWINSDDYLAHEALHTIGLNFSLNKGDLFVGCVTNFFEDSLKTEKFVNRGISIDNFLTLNSANPYKWHQPGVWFLIDKLKEIGVFNKDLRYCFDFEFTLKYIRKFDKVIYTDKTLVFFRYHGASKSVAEQSNFTNEFFISYKLFYDSLSYLDPLKFKALRKFKTFKWHIKLLSYCSSNKKSKLSKALFIFMNLACSPIFKATRMTFGQLKNILSK